MRARLQSLRDAGAEVFDGPGLRFIEALLGQAEALDSAAGEHLRRRAAERLSAFEAAFAAARAEARATLATLSAAGADPEGAFAEAFARGDYKHVKHEAVRALRLAKTDDIDTARDRVRRLWRQAQARGASLPPSLRARVEVISAESGTEAPLAELRTIGDRLAQALFREAADHARSALVVARATDRLPAQAGPYNPEALSAQALALVESLSPTYLRAYLTGLEDLDHLRRLPDGKDGKDGKKRRR